MIKVGRPIPESHRVGAKAQKKYMYRDVFFDTNGWAKVTDYLPLDFDLVYVMTDSGRSYAAWHTGQEWDGMKLTPEMKIVAWRRSDESSDSV